MAPVFLADGDATFLNTMDMSSEAAEEGESIGCHIAVAPVPMVNPTLEDEITGC